MIPLRIILEGDNCWPDLKDKEPILTDLVAVAALPSGMTSGKPSVAVRIDLPDGRAVIAQTSMRLFLMAARAFRARFGDVDEQD